MFDKDIEVIAAAATAAIDDALDLLKDEIDRRTPEDTKELIGNNIRSDVERVGNVIGGAISNDTEYAQFVEFGVGGRAYNYNKPKGSVFYTGVGARMFTRARDESEGAIQALINRSI